jgi:hypothetical protein
LRLDGTVGVPIHPNCSCWESLDTGDSGEDAA